MRKYDRVIKIQFILGVTLIILLMAAAILS